MLRRATRQRSGDGGHKEKQGTRASRRSRSRRLRPRHGLRPAAALLEDAGGRRNFGPGRGLSVRSDAPGRPETETRARDRRGRGRSSPNVSTTVAAQMRGRTRSNCQARCSRVSRDRARRSPSRLAARPHAPGDRIPGARATSYKTRRRRADGAHLDSLRVARPDNPARPGNRAADGTGGVQPTSSRIEPGHTPCHPRPRDRNHCEYRLTEADPMPRREAEFVVTETTPDSRTQIRRRQWQRGPDANDYEQRDPWRRPRAGVYQ